MDISFSENLIRVMREKNLKQVDIVKLTGFSKAKVSKLVNGSVEPKLSDLFLMCKVLDCCVMQICKGGIDVKKKG